MSCEKPNRQCLSAQEAIDTTSIVTQPKVSFLVHSPSYRMVVTTLSKHHHDCARRAMGSDRMLEPTHHAEIQTFRRQISWSSNELYTNRRLNTA